MDEKFPCWLDILDINLQEYRVSLSQDQDESKSRLSGFTWFGSKKKTDKQSELYSSWAYSLLGVDRLLSLSQSSLASFCYSQSMQPHKTRFQGLTVHVESILPPHAIDFLQTRQHERLADMYHDLEADSDLQKEAL